VFLHVVFKKLALFLFQDVFVLFLYVIRMRTVTLLQRESSEIPGVGSTIYLIQDQGLAAEASQYVRATKISHRVREFAVPGQGEKTFRRRELTMERRRTILHSLRQPITYVEFRKVWRNERETFLCADSFVYKSLPFFSHVKHPAT
jgi:hypothetical protein